MLDRYIEALIEFAGDEWSFLMGSEFKKKSDKIPGSPRRIYWATMSSYRMYAGGYSRDGGPDFDKNKGYLVIVSSEKQYSFMDAVSDLRMKMSRELGRDE